MPSTMAKRILPLAGVIIVLILAVLASLPYLASTNLVRERISQQISSWSGYRVNLDEAPDIDVFPSLKAVLHGVSVYEWGRDGTLVMKSERVEADLSLFSAFHGEADITGVTLVRPQFRAVRKPDGKLHIPIPSGGKLLNAIRAGQSDEDSGKLPPELRSPSAKIGTFSIVDGWVSSGTGQTGSDTLTSIDATISWPNLRRPLSIAGKAIWNGEAIEVKFDTAEPLSVLTSRIMPVAFSLKSAPVSVTFNGKADFTNSLFIDGKLDITTPSVQRALSWYGVDIPDNTALGPLTLAGTVNGEQKRLKFDNAKISLGENNGIGFLDLRQEETGLTIGGTLAFNSLDILAVLNTFGEIPENGTSMNPDFDLAFSRNVKLDLRLSAIDADAGPIMLKNVAANIQVNKGLTAIDVAGADALGGKVQAGLRFDRKSDGDTGEIRILASEINGKQLFDAFGIGWFSPDSPLTLSVIINGPATSWRSLASGAHGTVSAKFGSGVVHGFDIAAFAEKLKTPGFFALSETAEKTTSITNADIKLIITNGIGRVEKALIHSEKRVLSLSGLVAPFNGSVALAGKLVEDGNNPESPSYGFFMGGTPESPFVSPVLSSGITPE